MDRLDTVYQNFLLLRAGNCAPEDNAETKNNGDKVGTSSSSSEPLHVDSPLAELLNVSLPETLQISPQVKDLLLLLKMLESINRFATPSENIRLLKLVSKVANPTWLCIYIACLCMLVQACQISMSRSYILISASWLFPKSS